MSSNSLRQLGVLSSNGTVRLLKCLQTSSQLNAIHPAGKVFTLPWQPGNSIKTQELTTTAGLRTPGVACEPTPATATRTAKQIWAASFLRIFRQGVCFGGKISANSKRSAKPVAATSSSLLFVEVDVRLAEQMKDENDASHSCADDIQCAAF